MQKSIIASGKLNVKKAQLEFELCLITESDNRDVELNNLESYYTFAASGGIWNRRNTDYEICGQILDSEEYKAIIGNNPIYQSILTIWEQHHLNDLNAGTTLQQIECDKWRTANNNHSWAYTELCEHLKTVNLYCDRGYNYGSAWLVKIIPQDIVDKVIKLAELTKVA